MSFAAVRQGKRLAAAPLLAIAGVLLTTALYLYLHQGARETREILRQREAGEYAFAIREKLHKYAILLHSLRGAFALTPRITPQDFATVTAPVRPLVRAVRAIGWLHHDGAGDGPGGHYVIDIVQPLGPADREGADEVPGIETRPERRAALERACATGGIAVSEWRAGAHAGTGNSLVAMYLPVHPDGYTAGGVDAGTTCASVKGYLMLTVSIAHLLGDVFAAQGGAWGDIYLLDTEAAEGRRLAGAFVAPERGGARLDEAALAAASGTVTREIEAAGRHWRMVIVPPRLEWLWTGDEGALVALALGLLLTGLLTGYLRREDQAKAMLHTEARARAAMARMLRESEERFRLALRHSRVAVFSQDLELRYVWMYNPQAPIPADRFIGRSDGELFRAPDAERLDAVKRQVLETGRGTRQEVRLTIAGLVQVTDLVVEPLRGDDGEVIGLIGAGIDITESNRIKEALAEAHAEAERANMAKSRFLAAASHDLRQPFQAMSLFHHILLAQLGDTKQLSVARKLGEALAAGNALLNALLDASALESGNVVPHVVDFAFQEVADRLSTEIADQATGRGLIFRAVPTSALVRSDPVLLERILRNLLVNALRYTGRGAILLGCRRRAGLLSVEVWDTGPGIPGEHLERIFDEFYRATAEQRDGARGLGLGLSTVRRMAQLLDHRITVRSRLGHGTVFAVEIPLVDGPAETVATTPADQPPRTAAASA